MVLLRKTPKIEIENLFKLPLRPRETDGPPGEQINFGSIDVPAGTACQGGFPMVFPIASTDDPRHKEAKYLRF